MLGARIVIGNRWYHDHIIALVPACGCSDLVTEGELYGIEHTQYFFKVAARGHRIGKLHLDLFVRSDKENRAHRLVVIAVRPSKLLPASDPSIS